MDPTDLNLVLLVGTGVLIAAVAAVRLANGAGLPTLLIYLAIGIGLGESGLGLQFEDADLVDPDGDDWQYALPLVKRILS